MARSFLTAVNLNKNELQNAAVQNLGTAPSAPVKGQIYYDSTANILYWWNGTTWVAAQGGAGVIPAATVTTQAVGDAPVVGASTNYAREDHKHGREAFGGSVAIQTSFGLSAGIGVNTTLARSDHYHGTPTHDAAAHAAIPISALAPATGPINMGGFVIGNVGTPVAPTDAANKGYVDNSIAGLDWKNSVALATTANIALTGTQTIDGVAVSLNGVSVLVKSQTSALENGIYLSNSAGAWTRRTDADATTELVGAAVFVESGTVNADTAWVCTNDSAGFTLGTTPITWVQFAGGGAVTAGAGMTQSGNVLNVIGDATVTVAADSLGVADGGVTNAKLANMALSSVKGNAIATPSPPTDISFVQLAALLANLTVPVTRRYVDLTIGGAVSQVVTHNLGVNYPVVDVFNNSAPYATIDCDVERTNFNVVTLRFATAPAANSVGVTVIG